MPFGDQVANTEILAQPQAMLFGESQHVFYSFASLLVGAGVLVFGERLQRADYDLLGRVVPARAQLPLD